MGVEEGRNAFEAIDVRSRIRMRARVGANARYGYAWYGDGPDERRRDGADESQFGNIIEPRSVADADDHAAAGRLEPDADGRRVPLGHAAIRPARRRQALFNQ